jgi:hypothetical protein
MTNPNDQAFSSAKAHIDPKTGSVVYIEPNGLAKREHFAAIAMQGMMACSDFSATSPDKIAHISVEQADALISELNKEVEP